MELLVFIPMNENNPDCLPFHKIVVNSASSCEAKIIPLDLFVVSRESWRLGKSIDLTKRPHVME